MTDQQVINILQIFDGYLIESNIFLSAIRWLGWAIIKGLVSLVNTLEGAIRKVIGLTNFFESPEITKLINDFKPAIFMFLALSLACVAFFIFFSKKFDKKSVPTNIFLATMAILLLPFGMSKLNELTQAGINVVYGEFNSMANETVKNNIIDVYKYDENSFSSKEVSPKNYIEKDKIVMIDINEAIDKSQTSNEKVFENKVVAKKGGGYELKRIDGLFKIDSYYYRWKCNFWIIIISLLSTTATLSLSILKIGRLVFELAFNKVFGILIAYLDVANGQRLKKVVQRILTLFAVMFCMALMLKIYLIFSTWIGSRNLGILEVIMMIVVSIAVIDGPNIVEEILGVDAGLNSAWKTIAGLYAGSKMAGELAKGVGKATTGLAKFMSSTGSKLAEGMSAGIGFSSGVKEGKRNNLEDQMRENRAKNKDESKSSSLEGQMKKEGYDTNNKPLENYSQNTDKNNRDTLDKDVDNSKTEKGGDYKNLDKMLNDEVLKNEDSDKKSENSDNKILENDKGNIKGKEDENKKEVGEKLNSPSNNRLSSDVLENSREGTKEKKLSNKSDDEGKSMRESKLQDGNLLNKNDKSTKDSAINKDNSAKNSNLKENAQSSERINKNDSIPGEGRKNLEDSFKNNPGISEDKSTKGSIESYSREGNNETLNEDSNRANNGSLNSVDSLMSSGSISEDKSTKGNIESYDREGNNEILNEGINKGNNGSLNSVDSLMSSTNMPEDKSTKGSIESYSREGNNKILNEGSDRASNGSLNSADTLMGSTSISEGKSIKGSIESYSKEGYNKILNEGNNRISNESLNSADTLMSNQNISEGNSTIGSIENYSDGSLGEVKDINRTSNIGISSNDLNSCEINTPKLEKSNLESFGDLNRDNSSSQSNSNLKKDDTQNNKIVESRTFKDVVKEGFNNSKVGKEVIKVKRSYQIGKNTGKKYVEKKISKKERKNK